MALHYLRFYIGRGYLVPYCSCLVAFNGGKMSKYFKCGSCGAEIAALDWLPYKLYLIYSRWWWSKHEHKI